MLLHALVLSSARSVQKYDHATWRFTRREWGSCVRFENLQDLVIRRSMRVCRFNNGFVLIQECSVGWHKPRSLQLNPVLQRHICLYCLLSDIQGTNIWHINSRHRHLCSRIGFDSRLPGHDDILMALSSSSLAQSSQSSKWGDQQKSIDGICCNLCSLWSSLLYSWVYVHTIPRLERNPWQHFWTLLRALWRDHWNVLPSSLFMLWPRYFWLYSTSHALGFCSRTVHYFWSDSIELRSQHWCCWYCVFYSQFLNLNSNFTFLGIPRPANHLPITGRNIPITYWIVFHSSIRTVSVALLRGKEQLLQQRAKKLEHILQRKYTH